MLLKECQSVYLYIVQIIDIYTKKNNILNKFFYFQHNNKLDCILPFRYDTKKSKIYVIRRAVEPTKMVVTKSEGLLLQKPFGLFPKPSAWGPPKKPHRGFFGNPQRGAFSGNPRLLVQKPQRGFWKGLESQKNPKAFIGNNESILERKPNEDYKKNCLNKTFYQYFLYISKQSASLSNVHTHTFHSNLKMFLWKDGAEGAYQFKQKLKDSSYNMLVPFSSPSPRNKKWFSFGVREKQSHQFSHKLRLSSPFELGFNNKLKTNNIFGSFFPYRKAFLCYWLCPFVGFMYTLTLLKNDNDLSLNTFTHIFYSSFGFSNSFERQDLERAEKKYLNNLKIFRTDPSRRLGSQGKALGSSGALEQLGFDLGGTGKNMKENYLYNVSSYNKHSAIKFNESLMEGSKNTSILPKIKKEFDLFVLSQNPKGYSKASLEMGMQRNKKESGNKQSNLQVLESVPEFGVRVPNILKQYCFFYFKSLENYLKTAASSYTFPSDALLFNLSKARVGESQSVSKMALSSLTILQDSLKWNLDEASPPGKLPYVTFSPQNQYKWFWYKLPVGSLTGFHVFQNKTLEKGLVNNLNKYTYLQDCKGSSLPALWAGRELRPRIEGNVPALKKEPYFTPSFILKLSLFGDDNTFCSQSMKVSPVPVSTNFSSLPYGEKEQSGFCSSASGKSAMLFSERSLRFESGKDFGVELTPTGSAGLPSLRKPWVGKSIYSYIFTNSYSIRNPLSSFKKASALLESSYINLITFADDYNFFKNSSGSSAEGLSHAEGSATIRTSNIYSKLSKDNLYKLLLNMLKTSLKKNLLLKNKYGIQNNTSSLIPKQSLGVPEGLVDDHKHFNYHNLNSSLILETYNELRIPIIPEKNLIYLISKPLSERESKPYISWVRLKNKKSFSLLSKNAYFGPIPFQGYKSARSLWAPEERSSKSFLSLKPSLGSKARTSDKKILKYSHPILMSHSTRNSDIKYPATSGTKQPVVKSYVLPLYPTGSKATERCKFINVTPIGRLEAKAPLWKNPLGFSVIEKTPVYSREQAAPSVSFPFSSLAKASLNPKQDLVLGINTHSICDPSGTGNERQRNKYKERKENQQSFLHLSKNLSFNEYSQYSKFVNLYRDKLKNFMLFYNLSHSSFLKLTPWEKAKLFQNETLENSKPKTSSLTKGELVKGHTSDRVFVDGSTNLHFSYEKKGHKRKEGQINEKLLRAFLNTKGSSLLGDSKNIKREKHTYNIFQKTQNLYSKFKTFNFLTTAKLPLISTSVRRNIQNFAVSLRSDRGLDAKAPYLLTPSSSISLGNLRPFPFLTQGFASKKPKEVFGKGYPGPSAEQQTFGTHTLAYGEHGSLGAINFSKNYFPKISPLLLIKNRSFILDKNLTIKNMSILGKPSIEKTTMQAASSPGTSILGKEFGIGDGVSSSLTTTVVESEGSKVDPSFSFRKHEQKKRRIKKLKKETRVRKKRKRFYPRPLWIRYRLYTNFLKKRTNLPFGKLSFLPTPERAFSSRALNYNSEQGAKQPQLSFFTTRPNKKMAGHSLVYAGGEGTYNFKTFLSLNANKGFYTISRAVLGDLKRVLWKSYWLRSNLNPYLIKVKTMLSQMKKSTQTWDFYKTLRTFILYVGGFKDFDGQKYKYMYLPMPSLSKGWNSYGDNPFNLSGTSNLRGDNSKPQYLNFEALSYNKWQNALYLAEYDRITYGRLQQYIAQIRENVTSLGQNKLRLYHIGHSNTQTLSPFGRKKKKDFFQKDKQNSQDLWVKIGKTIMATTEGYSQVSALNNGITGKQFIITPRIQPIVPQLRMYWALSKTNYGSFMEKEMHKRKQTWTVGKTREQTKYNKTKKIYYILSKKLENFNGFFGNKEFLSSNNKSIYLSLNKTNLKEEKALYFGFKRKSSENLRLLKKNLQQYNNGMWLFLPKTQRFYQKHPNRGFFGGAENQPKSFAQAYPSIEQDKAKNLKETEMRENQKISYYTWATKLTNKSAYWWDIKNFAEGFPKPSAWVRRVPLSFPLTTAKLHFGFLPSPLSSDFKFKERKEEKITYIIKKYEQNNQNLWISSLLFHFCAILSLISLSQIRSLFKVYMIFIGKIYKTSVWFLGLSYDSINNIKNFSYFSSKTPYSPINVTSPVPVNNNGFKDKEGQRKKNLITTSNLFKNPNNVRVDPYLFFVNACGSLLNVKEYGQGVKNFNFFYLPSAGTKNLQIQQYFYDLPSLAFGKTHTTYINQPKFYTYMYERNLSSSFFTKQSNKFITSEGESDRTSVVNQAFTGHVAALTGTFPYERALSSDNIRAYVFLLLRYFIQKPIYLFKKTLKYKNIPSEGHLFDDQNNTLSESHLLKQNTSFIDFSSLSTYNLTKFKESKDKQEYTKMGALKTYTSLYSLLCLNSVSNITYNFYFGTSSILKQTVETIGILAPRSIFSFFEKPGELILDWIAYMFLVEWASDITNTIPENVDVYIGNYFNKLLLSKVSLWNTLQNVNNITVLSLNFPTLGKIQYLSNLSGGTLSPGYNFALADFTLKSAAKDGGLPLFSETFNNKYYETYYTSIFSNIWDKLFLNVGSTFLQRRIYHLYEILFFQFYQPDTDLINRHKKGVIFWDIWGDFLMQVAEDSNINISELTSVKEEQIKLLEKCSDATLNFFKFKQNSVQAGSKLRVSPFYTSPFFGGLTAESGNYVNKAKEKKKSLNINLAPTFMRVENARSKGGNAFGQQNAQNNWINGVMTIGTSGPVNGTSRFKNSTSWPRSEGNFDELWGSEYAPYLQGNPPFGTGSQQFLSYQGKDTELFIDLHPPKNFIMNLLNFNESVQQPVGSLVCQIFSGLLSKQISKNILVVSCRQRSDEIKGNFTSNQGLQRIGAVGMEKTLLVQAIAGETELKIITDNAYRYAMVYRGVAVGIKLLRDVFDSLALHTPCLFLIEDIHAIGERRPLLISDGPEGDNKYNISSSFGSQREEIHEKNQILYQLSKHVITHYRKPYKGDFSLLIPTNHFCFDLFRGCINSSSSIGEELTRNTKLAGLSSEKTLSPRILINSATNISGPSEGQGSVSHEGQEQGSRKHFSSTRLLMKSSELLAPPAYSPFSVLTLKEEKKFKPYKVVSEMPWSGLPGEQLAQVSKASYSLRVKVALLADMAISSLSVKLDMITDLLVIIDSVKGNRGFVVFATTHVPYILDPALRRPGRLDETITLASPSAPTLLSRWEILKSTVISNVSVSGLTYSKNFNLNSSLGFSRGFNEQTGFYKGITLDYASSLLTLTSFSSINSIQYYKCFKAFISKKNNPYSKISLIPFREMGNGKKRLCQKQIQAFGVQGMGLHHFISTPSADSNLFNMYRSLSKSALPLHTGLERKQAKLWSNTHINLNSLKKEKDDHILRENHTALLYSKYMPTLLISSVKRKILAQTYFMASLMVYKNSLFSMQKTKKTNIIAFNRDSLSLGLQNNPDIKDRVVKERELPFLFKPQQMFDLPFGGTTETSFYLSFYSSPSINCPLKNQMIQLIAGKLGEMLYFSKTSRINEMNDLNFLGKPNLQYSPLQLQMGVYTSYGLNTWQMLSSLIVSFVHKRFIYHQNLIVPNSLSFNNISPLMEPPSPPASNILLPARRYENYKRSFAFFSVSQSSGGNNKTSLGIMEKIQLHQQQRLVKRLYRYPVKESFRSEIIENRLTGFSNAALNIGKLNDILQKPSRTLSFIKNRILMRHKDYFTNQWWTGQLPEHNAETTYLSDIDWRYTFVESVGDLLLDFPDADQYYNPRNRRWLLTKGSFHNWFDFDKNLYSEIYSHFIFDSFVKAYQIYEINREGLDYYAFHVLQNGLHSTIHELDYLKLYKRFFKS
nr:cell division protein FTSH [Chlorogonium euchlorum]